MGAGMRFAALQAALLAAGYREERVPRRAGQRVFGSGEPAANARRAVPARSKATIDATSQALSLPSARRPASPPSRHFCDNILVLAAVFADG